MPTVRLAALVIDPARIDSYREELRREIADSIAHEPGVLSLSAVYEADHPERVHLMEIYADEAAYEAHVSSPYFLRYKAATKDMVRSLTLTETIPILLGAKPGAAPRR